MILRKLSLFLAILLSASLLFAAEGMTPSDVAKLRSVGAVAISPDGSHVAYTLTVPRDPMAEADGPAWVELHVAGRDGGSRRVLTGGGYGFGGRLGRRGRGSFFFSRPPSAAHPRRPPLPPPPLQSPPPLPLPP